MSGTLMSGTFTSGTCKTFHKKHSITPTQLCYFCMKCTAIQILVSHLRLRKSPWSRAAWRLAPTSTHQPHIKPPLNGLAMPSENRCSTLQAWKACWSGEPVASWCSGRVLDSFVLTTFRPHRLMKFYDFIVKKSVTFRFPRFVPHLPGEGC